MGSSTKDLLALTEGILNTTPPVKEVVAVGADRIVDDGLKAVVVPDAFVDQILGFNNALTESSDPEKKQAMMPVFEPITEATILKERLESLVENLKQLLKEAKEVMQEMNTVGGLGTGCSTRKKKNGSRRGNKRNQGY
jgi:hypothetical protein